MVTTTGATDPTVLPAVLEHYRWWIADDGIDLQRFRDEVPTKPKGQDLRKIATRYRVGRGLRRGKECEYLEFIQNALRSEWPTGLNNRANRIVEISKAAHKDGLTSGVTVLLASKVVWHFKPAGWTLFDKYAANAVLGKKHVRSVERIVQFYEKLETFEFDSIIAKMNDAKSESDLPHLWSERIFDKWLLNNSDSENEAFAMPGESFKGVVGDRTFSSLEKLAIQLEKVLPRGLLVK